MLDTQTFEVSPADWVAVPATAAPLGVAELIEHGLSENTRRAYRSDLASFRSWGGEIPTSPEQLAEYIADQGNRLNPSTIRRRIQAIGAAHSAVSPLDHPHHHPMVRASLRGLRRLRGASQKHAAPLMLEDLIQILDSAGDTMKDLRDRALLLIGFAGGFRRSELVDLDFADIEHVPEGMIITLRRSKTDQDGIGRKVGIPFGRKRWCPVQTLGEWMNAIDCTDGPIFRPVHKGGYVGAARLSGDAVSKIVKARIAGIGHDPDKFSGHSMRAGLVTSASRIGISGFAIRRQTGHASDLTMSRYVRDGELFSDNAVSRLL